MGLSKICRFPLKTVAFWPNYTPRILCYLNSSVISQGTRTRVKKMENTQITLTEIDTTTSLTIILSQKGDIASLYYPFDLTMQKAWCLFHIHLRVNSYSSSSVRER